jgi:hypothetical protein
MISKCFGLRLVAVTFLSIANTQAYIIKGIPPKKSDLVVFNDFQGKRDLRCSLETLWRHFENGKHFENTMTEDAWGNPAYRLAFKVSLTLPKARQILFEQNLVMTNIFEENGKLKVYDYFYQEEKLATGAKITLTEDGSFKTFSVVIQEKLVTCKFN